jgi:hypothetical protein
MIGIGFIFGSQGLKICQKYKRKKCPISQNKKVKKGKDVDLKVWWKLGQLKDHWPSSPMMSFFYIQLDYMSNLIKTHWPF